MDDDPGCSHSSISTSLLSSTMTVYACTDGTSIVINNYDFAFNRLFINGRKPSANFSERN